MLWGCDNTDLQIRHAIPLPFALDFYPLFITLSLTSINIVIFALFWNKHVDKLADRQTEQVLFLRQRKNVLNSLLW